MKVLVCGSRDWLTPSVIGQRLSELPGGGVSIIHGGARGADSIADGFAREFGIPQKRFPADWENHGRRAGIVRNLRMLDEKPDLVLAFWDGKSRGTAHTIDEARRRGIPVEVIAPSGSADEGEHAQ